MILDFRLQICQPLNLKFTRLQSVGQIYSFLMKLATDFNTVPLAKVKK